MNYLIYATTALIVSFSIWYMYAKYKLSYWSRRGVKTPPTHLIFGNFKEVFTFKKSPNQLMREIYNYADPDDPYIGFYVFHKPMLLLRDCELIKQTMVKDFEVFPNRRFGSTSEKDVLGMMNLLSVKQPKWKYLRGKLTPVLTGKKLKGMLPLMIETGIPMLDCLDSLPVNKAGNKEYEVKQLGSRYTTDIMATLAFGISTNSFHDENTFLWELGLRIFVGLKSGLSLIILFFVPEWSNIIGPFIRGPAKSFRNIFWHSMNEREKSGVNRGDLIDFLVALKNGEQDPVFKFEGDNLLAQATALYIAGFEATATAIAFAFFEIARHPEHQATLYEEIKTILTGKKLTTDLINEMSFLDCIVNEILRLYPPLPITDRIAQKDYELPTGLILEKGTPIYLSINATNQDPKYFSNPQDFIPTRIKDNDKKFYESLAFGVGPRACIGQRMALLIVKMSIITAISKYELSWNAKKQTQFNYPSVFTYTLDGLFVQFKKRDEVITY